MVENWIMPYLTDRSQFIDVGSSESMRSSTARGAVSL